VAAFLHRMQPADASSSGAVAILRPEATHGAQPGNVVLASTWQPIQRASGEELPATNLQPETVQVRGSDPMPRPVETPVAIEIGQGGPVTGDKPSTADKDKDKDKDKGSTLHSPSPLVSIAPPLEIQPDGPPKEFCKKSLPSYVVEPPDILLIQSAQKMLLDQPLTGQHLVRPDGTVGLGIYGEARVAGMTLEQVKQAVADSIRTHGFPDVDIKKIDVDVIAYNSKVYYIVTDGGGYGEQVYRIPVTGNETILDAMSQINGLPAVASKKKIWLARATPGDGAHPIVLPVDWRRVTMLGVGSTNYQVFPGDRIYVGADPWIHTDSWLAKRLAPVERLLGITLLGSSTVNSIRNGNNGTGTGSLP
jgi:polysaccharide export outer membrane protein